MRFAHPIARSLERYHVLMKPRDFDNIKAIVTNNQPEALPLGLTPDGSILVAVRYRPQGSYRRWFATVWRGSDILTVLPPRSLMRYGGVLAVRRRKLREMGREGCGCRSGWNRPAWEAGLVGDCVAHRTVALT